jgi:hypothetical protein
MIYGYTILTVCACSLKYPAWNMDTPYWECVPVAIVIQHTMHLHHIAICGLTAIKYFPNYLITGIIFEIKSFTNKYMFSFSLQISPKTFHFLRRNERVLIKIYFGLQLKNYLVRPIIMNLEFFARYQKYPSTKFYENPSSGNRFVSCEPRDGQKWRI